MTQEEMNDMLDVMFEQTKEILAQRIQINTTLNDLIEEQKREAIIIHWTSLLEYYGPKGITPPPPREWTLYESYNAAFQWLHNQEHHQLNDHLLVNDHIAERYNEQPMDMQFTMDMIGYPVREDEDGEH